MNGSLQLVRGEKTVCMSKAIQRFTGLSLGRRIRTLLSMEIPTSTEYNQFYTGLFSELMGTFVDLFNDPSELNALTGYEVVHLFTALIAITHTCKEQIQNREYNPLMRAFYDRIFSGEFSATNKRIIQEMAIASILHYTSALRMTNVSAENYASGTAFVLLRHCIDGASDNHLPQMLLYNILFCLFNSEDSATFELYFIFLRKLIFDINYPQMFYSETAEEATYPSKTRRQLMSLTMQALCLSFLFGSSVYLQQMSDEAAELESLMEKQGSAGLGAFMSYRETLEDFEASIYCSATIDPDIPSECASVSNAREHSLILNAISASRTVMLENLVTRMRACTAKICSYSPPTLTAKGSCTYYSPIFSEASATKVKRCGEFFLRSFTSQLFGDFLKLIQLVPRYNTFSTTCWDLCMECLLRLQKLSFGHLFYTSVRSSLDITRLVDLEESREAEKARPPVSRTEPLLTARSLSAEPHETIQPNEPLDSQKGLNTSETLNDLCADKVAPGLGAKGPHKKPLLSQSQHSVPQEASSLQQRDMQTARLKKTFSRRLDKKKERQDDHKPVSSVIVNPLIARLNIASRQDTQIPSGAVQSVPVAAPDRDMLPSDGRSGQAQSSQKPSNQERLPGKGQEQDTKKGDKPQKTGLFRGRRAAHGKNAVLLDASHDTATKETSSFDITLREILRNNYPYIDFVRLYVLREVSAGVAASRSNTGPASLALPQAALSHSFQPEMFTTTHSSETATSSSSDSDYDFQQTLDHTHPPSRHFFLHALDSPSVLEIGRFHTPIAFHAAIIFQIFEVLVSFFASYKQLTMTFSDTSSLLDSHFSFISNSIWASASPAVVAFLDMKYSGINKSYLDAFLLQLHQPMNKLLAPRSTHPTEAMLSTANYTTIVSNASSLDLHILPGPVSANVNDPESSLLRQSDNTASTQTVTECAQLLTQNEETVSFLRVIYTTYYKMLTTDGWLCAALKQLSDSLRFLFVFLDGGDTIQSLTQGAERDDDRDGAWVCPLKNSSNLRHIVRVTHKYIFNYISTTYMHFLNSLVIASSVPCYLNCCDASASRSSTVYFELLSNYMQTSSACMAYGVLSRPGGGCLQSFPGSVTFLLYREIFHMIYRIKDQFSESTTSICTPVLETISYNAAAFHLQISEILSCDSDTNAVLQQEENYSLALDCYSQCDLGSGARLLKECSKVFDASVRHVSSDQVPTNQGSSKVLTPSLSQDNSLCNFLRSLASVSAMLRMQCVPLVASYKNTSFSTYIDLIASLRRETQCRNTSTYLVHIWSEFSSLLASALLSDIYDLENHATLEKIDDCLMRASLDGSFSGDDASYIAQADVHTNEQRRPPHGALDQQPNFPEPADDFCVNPALPMANIQLNLSLCNMHNFCDRFDPRGCDLGSSSCRGSIDRDPTSSPHATSDASYDNPFYTERGIPYGTYSKFRTDTLLTLVPGSADSGSRDTEISFKRAYFSKEKPLDIYIVDEAYDRLSAPINISMPHGTAEMSNYFGTGCRQLSLSESFRNTSMQATESSICFYSANSFAYNEGFLNLIRMIMMRTRPNSETFITNMLNFVFGFHCDYLWPPDIRTHQITLLKRYECDAAFSLDPSTMSALVKSRVFKSIEIIHSSVKLYRPLSYSSKLRLKLAKHTVSKKDLPAAKSFWHVDILLLRQKRSPVFLDVLVKQFINLIFSSLIPDYLERCFVLQEPEPDKVDRNARQARHKEGEFPGESHQASGSCKQQRSFPAELLTTVPLSSHELTMSCFREVFVDTVGPMSSLAMRDAALTSSCSKISTAAPNRSEALAALNAYNALCDKKEPPAKSSADNCSRTAPNNTRMCADIAIDFSLLSELLAFIGTPEMLIAELISYLQWHTVPLMTKNHTLSAHMVHGFPDRKGARQEKSHKYGKDSCASDKRGTIKKGCAAISSEVPSTIDSYLPSHSGQVASDITANARLSANNVCDEHHPLRISAAAVDHYTQNSVYYTSRLAAVYPQLVTQALTMCNIFNDIMTCIISTYLLSGITCAANARLSFLAALNSLIVLFTPFFSSFVALCSCSLFATSRRYYRLVAHPLAVVLPCLVKAVLFLRKAAECSCTVHSDQRCMGWNAILSPTFQDHGQSAMTLLAMIKLIVEAATKIFRSSLFEQRSATHFENYQVDAAPFFISVGWSLHTLLQYDIDTNVFAYYSVFLGAVFSLPLCFVKTSSHYADTLLNTRYSGTLPILETYFRSCSKFNIGIFDHGYLTRIYFDRMIPENDQGMGPSDSCIAPLYDDPLRALPLLSATFSLNTTRLMFLSLITLSQPQIIASRSHPLPHYSVTISDTVAHVLNFFRGTESGSLFENTCTQTQTPRTHELANLINMRLKALKMLNYGDNTTVSLAPLRGSVSDNKRRCAMPTYEILALFSHICLLYLPRMFTSEPLILEIDSQESSSSSIVTMEYDGKQQSEDKQNGFTTTASRTSCDTPILDKSELLGGLETPGYSSKDLLKDTVVVSEYIESATDVSRPSLSQSTTTRTLSGPSTIVSTAFRIHKCNSVADAPGIQDSVFLDATRLKHGNTFSPQKRNLRMYEDKGNQAMPKRSDDTSLTSLTLTGGRSLFLVNSTSSEAHYLLYERPFYYILQLISDVLFRSCISFGARDMVDFLNISIVELTTLMSPFGTQLRHPSVTPAQSFIISKTALVSCSAIVQSGIVLLGDSVSLHVLNTLAGTLLSLLIEFCEILQSMNVCIAYQEYELLSTRESARLSCSSEDRYNSPFGMAWQESYGISFLTDSNLLYTLVYAIKLWNAMSVYVTTFSEAWSYNLQFSSTNSFAPLSFMGVQHLKDASLAEYVERLLGHITIKLSTHLAFLLTCSDDTETLEELVKAHLTGNMLLGSNILTLNAGLAPYGATAHDILSCHCASRHRKHLRAVSDAHNISDLFSDHSFQEHRHTQSEMEVARKLDAKKSSSANAASENRQSAICGRNTLIAGKFSSVKQGVQLMRIFLNSVEDLLRPQYSAESGNISNTLGAFVAALALRLVVCIAISDAHIVALYEPRNDKTCSQVSTVAFLVSLEAQGTSVFRIDISNLMSKNRLGILLRKMHPECGESSSYASSIADCKSKLMPQKTFDYKAVISKFSDQNISDLLMVSESKHPDNPRSSLLTDDSSIVAMCDVLDSEAFEYNIDSAINSYLTRTINDIQHIEKESERLFAGVHADELLHANGSGLSYSALFGAQASPIRDTYVSTGNHRAILAQNSVSAHGSSEQPKPSSEQQLIQNENPSSQRNSQHFPDAESVTDSGFRQNKAAVLRLQKLSPSANATLSWPEIEHVGHEAHPRELLRFCADIGIIKPSYAECGTADTLHGATNNDLLHLDSFAVSTKVIILIILYTSEHNNRCTQDTRSQEARGQPDSNQPEACSLPSQIDLELHKHISNAQELQNPINGSSYNIEYRLCHVHGVLKELYVLARECYSNNSIRVGLVFYSHHRCESCHPRDDSVFTNQCLSCFRNQGLQYVAYESIERAFHLNSTVPPGQRLFLFCMRQHGVLTTIYEKSSRQGAAEWILNPLAPVLDTSLCTICTESLFLHLQTRIAMLLEDPVLGVSARSSRREALQEYILKRATHGDFEDIIAEMMSSA